MMTSDNPIRLTSDASPAESSEPAMWLEGRLLPWGVGIGTRVASVVPLGFESYARVFHPATAPGAERSIVSWDSVAQWSGAVVHPEMQWEAISHSQHARERCPWNREPALGFCPPEVIEPLCEALDSQTSRPDTVYIAIWTGFSAVQEIIRQAPRFELPGREYALFKAPLVALPRIIETPFAVSHGPSLWWPADRAWVVGTEVDFRWTYVGGSDACVASVERASVLEVLRTLPEHRGDIAGDRLNDMPQR